MPLTPIKHIDSNDFSPLGIAIIENHLKIAKILIKA